MASSALPAVTPVHAGQPEIEYAVPLEDDEDRLDAYYVNEPLRYHTMANILGDQSTLEQAERLFTQLHLTHAGKPTTYVETQGDLAWWAAME